MDYRQAGVDVAAGHAFVSGIRDLVARTRRPEVLGTLGGFAGLCRIPQGYREPILVSGTDGVGTKLKIAQGCDRHDTIGVDLVAMCVNDVLTCGAEPLFFLDYLATGTLQPEQLTAVVRGIVVGCEQAGCALLGGETAEMPGFYGAGEYDVAGFCVGIVERDRLLDGSQVQVGDRVIGLASSGLHSNGFSLVRRILEVRGIAWSDPVPEAIAPQPMTWGDLLLTPTQIYVSIIREALDQWEIHGLAHITGGGLPENLPRCLGVGQSVQVNRLSWSIPALFNYLGELGAVPQEDLFSTFNMGIGMAVVASAMDTPGLLSWFHQRGFCAWIIGDVVTGDRTLIWA
ncbi:MAG: phosphoribosylformylglycinamidine cyclo-ligase [Oscillatoriales cyanobacterium SM2_2_1]|nr:phosphoribosylformylglycinamidine cyclo-ligase [Oscillatoriales cyanobacterium SM2_2_1]